MLQTRRIGSIYRGETWREAYQVKDPAGALVDLTGSSFTIWLRPIDCLGWDDDYGFRNWGAALSGSTEGGEITFLGLGTIEWDFSSEQTGSLYPGDYRCRLTGTRDGTTTVFFETNISIL